MNGEYELYNRDKPSIYPCELCGKRYAIDELDEECDEHYCRECVKTFSGTLLQ